MSNIYSELIVLAELMGIDLSIASFGRDTYNGAPQMRVFPPKYTYKSRECVSNYEEEYKDHEHNFFTIQSNMKVFTITDCRGYWDDKHNIASRFNIPIGGSADYPTILI